MPRTPLATKTTVNSGGGERQEVTENSGRSVDQHRQLPEEPVLKWTVRITPWGLWLWFQMLQRASVLGLMQDALLTTGQSQLAVIQTHGTLLLRTASWWTA